MSPTSGLATVTRLHPIRTLTIGQDLAFRQRAMTVLAGLGPASFVVGGAEQIGDVVELVVREQADVVVLDIALATPALAPVLAALAARVPHVGVVAVADEGRPHAPLQPVLQKWGWAADLSRAVVDAYHRGNPLKESSSHARQHHRH